MTEGLSIFRIEEQYFSTIREIMYVQLAKIKHLQI